MSIGSLRVRVTARRAREWVLFGEKPKARGPQRPGAQRRRPRGSPVARAPPRTTAAAVRELAAEQRTPGASAEAQRVRGGTPSVTAARAARLRGRTRSMTYRL